VPLFDGPSIGPSTNTLKSNKIWWKEVQCGSTDRKSYSCSFDNNKSAIESFANILSSTALSFSGTEHSR
jgi:hypothetical protein